MSEKLPLDPEPWACYKGDTITCRHPEEHEGYVYFEPRPSYSQNEEEYDR